MSSMIKVGIGQGVIRQLRPVASRSPGAAKAMSNSAGSSTQRKKSKTGIAGSTATSGRGILKDASTSQPTLLG
jgi:hypothetical protein